MDLSEVVQGIDEQEELALEQFITEFFAALLQQVRNYCDPAENVSPPLDTDIVHSYLDNASAGFTMVENFANIIKSGDHVVLTNETVFLIWLFSSPLGGGWTKTLQNINCSIACFPSNVVHCMLSINRTQRQSNNVYL